MFCGRVLIIENKNLAPGYYRLTLLAPEVAALAKPGQFIQIRVASAECNDPLLARPISIYSFDQASGNISVIFKTVGRGTAILAEKSQGELIGVFGPVGNGFEIPEGVKEIAFIAGGVGMPPLFSLAEDVNHKHSDQQLSLFYGGRTRGDLLELDHWSRIGAKVYTATEDGSYGRQGLVTELFLEQYRMRKYDFLAACGPGPMLQSVQKIAMAEDIPGQLSLEAHMACGVGACLGCTCKTNQGYRRVCVDGPVFAMKEVVWE